MATHIIHGHRILSYEHEVHRQKYWGALSKHVIEKFGEDEYTDQVAVENILLDCFDYLVTQFKTLIFEETTIRFFNHIFFLHEESWDFLVKTRSGFSFDIINEADFSRYRRILKLILEQGCDIDLNWGQPLTPPDIRRIEMKVQELFYIGTWIYTFADYISYHKMAENSKKINFNGNSQLGVYWKEPFDFVYSSLFPSLEADYERAIVEPDGTAQLRDQINICFGIDYNMAVGLIFQLKRHFSNSPTQTIEPYVLPINLAANFNISQDTAQCFYNGLSISRNNKMSVEDAILKPYSTERYMYRPILIYKIDNIDRALIGEGKVAESIYVLATNAISWNTIPSDWKENKCMVKYMSKKGNEHDSLLEDKVQEIIMKLKMPFFRNIKSFKRSGKDNINIDNELAGEIDFIIINHRDKILYVADSKYNKAKFEAVGYRTDNTNFKTKYEAQLERKIRWVEENKEVVHGHFQIIYGSEFDFKNYSVEGVFFINTPTFYMFNGRYKTLVINKLESYLDGTFKFPTLRFTPEGKSPIEINHPYFK
jgi:hypothetical protein